jgi:eukaryotic-like serine/threonine-protein kinase
VGTTVGQRWTLLGVIGSGGTATVYEAVHRNGSRVAVKMLHAEFNSHERIRRRFQAEAYAANLVRHSGVVNVLDDGETEEGGAYLVMELLEGETLAARLQREGPLPADRVREWGVAVLEILAAAHERNVVHRDVKPSNIFVTQRGEVKLLDFGIARISTASLGDELVTQQGVALGTPAFMAPEQASGNHEEVGAATDVWGVGATLFQLLTGHPVQEPSSASSSAEVGTARPVRALAPKLSLEMAKVVDRALSLRSSDRWPTAQAMIRALELAREVPLNSNDDSNRTLTEEAVVVPKPALIARPNLALTLGLLISLTGGLYWLISDRPVSASHPVAHSSTVPARAARTEVEPAVPSQVEIAAVEAVPSASPPKINSVVSKESTASAVPPRKPSVAPPSTQSKPPAPPKAEAVDFDSMLDRRK